MPTNTSTNNDSSTKSLDTKYSSKNYKDHSNWMYNWLEFVKEQYS